jgi:hypothetical protein
MLEDPFCSRGRGLSVAILKGNDGFSFSLECRSASPEVVQVYASIVHGHDDGRGHDDDGHESGGHDDDSDVDDGVYNRVARYTGRYREDGHRDMTAAPRPRQGYPCEHRPLPSPGRPLRRLPTTRAWR